MSPLLEEWHAGEDLSDTCVYRQDTNSAKMLTDTVPALEGATRKEWRGGRELERYEGSLAVQADRYVEVGRSEWRGKKAK